MDAITLVIISILIFIFFPIVKKYRERMKMLEIFPTPKGFPFIGNAWQLLRVKPLNLLKTIENFHAECGSTIRVMIGPYAAMLFLDPKDVEAILGSQKILEKSDEYNFLIDWLGTGLLISANKKWFSRRKVITPAFHFKILDQFVEIFDKHSTTFVENLKRLSSDSANGPVDVFQPITLCTLDIICEAAMGVEMNAQVSSDSEYVTAVKEITAVVMSRSPNVFLRNDFIFKLTSKGKRHDELLKILHNFTDSVIISRREELMKKKIDNKVHDNKEDDIGVKQKMAFLDILLQSTIDGEALSNMDIREEVDTFMFEGHDTTSSGIAFCLYVLAKHLKIQQKAFEEVRHVLGDDLNKPATLKDLNEMKYLEMVIKESLRLYPPVAAYGRSTSEDFNINGKIIPKGTSVGVSPYLMARDPKLWKDPLNFIPERFDENREQMHAYLNIPFSAGPRNCIGQRFAMLEMKSTISKVLRNFELAIPHNFEPQLVFEIILRPYDGMMLLINKRKY